MNTLEALDELLAIDESRYLADDLFLEVEDLIGTLSDRDVPSLLSLWQTRPKAWQMRFSQDCSGIQTPVLVAILGITLEPSTEPALILNLMTRLPNKADNSDLNRKLVEFAEKLWRTDPALRRQIQICAWSCGLSGRLRRALGLDSWQDVRF